MHEFAIDEVLLRATLKGIITRYQFVARYEPERDDEWTVWPALNTDEPITYNRDGIEDYCAALMEAGI